MPKAKVTRKGPFYVVSGGGKRVSVMNKTDANSIRDARNKRKGRSK